MNEWVQVRRSRSLQPRSARLLVSVIGILLLTIALGASTMPNAVPHGPEMTNCAACHGPPLDGNEEEVLADEGRYLIDNQPPVSALADGLGGISGYASSSYVRQGSTIDFHISAASSVNTYDLVVFRTGSDTPVPILTVKNLPGRSYGCRNPVGVEAGQEGVTLGCGWPVAYTLQVPRTWRSGIYAAAMLDANDTLTPDRLGSYILFVVTEDNPGSTSDILFQASTNTWQAYNRYGRWSLYTEPPARRITFDRPYIDCRIGTKSWSTCRTLWTTPLASWLESEGYTVEYTTNEEVHARPGLLSKYNLFLSVGHDEYWSRENRLEIDRFLNAGGNVAFFSGNTGMRQVRYQQGDRTLVCYKWKDHKRDPLYGVNNKLVAMAFASDVIRWPENTTTGVGFRNGGWVNLDGTNTYGRYKVYRSGHWVYAGTGLKDGYVFEYETGPAIEVDGALYTMQNGLPVATGTDQSPRNFTILGVERSTTGHATMGVYTHSGGGLVFNAATMGWGNGLWPQNNPRDYQKVRQITRNVINRLSQATPSTNRAPTVSAGSDQMVTLGENAQLNGTVSDDGRPNPPAQVTTTWRKISGPGTVTFDDAHAPETTATFGAGGTYVLRLTATDGALSASDDTTVVVQTPGSPTATPAPTTAPGADLAIGHEAGLDEYDLLANPGGDLGQSTAAALSGTAGGMAARINDQAALYGTKNFTRMPGTAYRFRHYLDPNGIVLPASTQITLAQMRGSGNRLATRLFADSDGGYRLYVRYVDDNGTWRSTAMRNITDAEHYIEVLVEFASSPSAKDGRITYWIDGVQAARDTGLDLYDSASRPTQMRMGAIWVSRPGVNGTLYLDEFVLRGDAALIGPGPDGQDPTPTPAPTNTPTEEPEPTPTPTNTPTEEPEPTPTPTNTPTEEPGPTPTPTNTPTEEPQPTPTPTSTPTEEPQPTPTPTSTPTEEPQPTPTPTNTPTGEQHPGALAIIRHEQDLSEYDRLTGGADLSQNSAAALAGSSGGQQIIVDDETILYGTKNFSRPTGTAYRFRHYVDPNALAMPNYGQISLAQVRGFGSSLFTRLRYTADGGYQLYVRYIDDNGTWRSTRMVPISDAEHYVEVLVEFASSASARDGRLTYWVDGVQVDRDAGLDIYDLSRRPTQLRLGAIWVSNSSIQGTLFLDEFVVRGDAAEIGP